MTTSEDLIEKVLSHLITTKDTPYKIAKETGISAMSIGRYIKRQSMPTIANARILLQYFEGTLPDYGNAKALDNIEFMAIPLVPISAQAGYPHGYGDEDYIESLPTIPVIVDKNYKGKYRIFEVNGDSMDDGSRNSICDKDKILCREVKKEFWKCKLHIDDWYFVIVHKTEGVTFKQITNHNVDTGNIVCHPINPLFNDFTLNLEDVLELYNVIKIVDRNARI